MAVERMPAVEAEEMWDANSISKLQDRRKALEILDGRRPTAPTKLIDSFDCRRRQYITMRER